MARGSVVIGSLLGVALVCLALGTLAGPNAADPLPRVVVEFPSAQVDDLFAPAADDDDGRRRLPAVVTDVDGRLLRGKVALRGFSTWHHGRDKPSLRAKLRDDDGGPQWLELSRPEDPLALCNWLPDRLADRLGLLHERSEPVHMWLDGRSAGVYLRSLRPGDDLIAAAARARGTFWKGDCLGDEARNDLWRCASAWRGHGACDPAAERALAAVLALLREPASTDNLLQLRRWFDCERAARAQAVAVLVASIHADRVHNHVWFHDPIHDRLEPLLWDANGFGIHAEPTLPVEVLRHPLAERLACDPTFVHRRNQVLWDLLHGAGAAAHLLAIADAHAAAQAVAAATDPAIARLRLARGRFTAEVVGAAGMTAERVRLAAFVTARERLLRAHFADARVHFADDPTRVGHTLVTVAGAVAVRLTRDDGGPVLGADGRDASVVLPGLSAALTDTPQRVGADGSAVAAPCAEPAPLTWVVAVPRLRLRAGNAFTGAAVVAADTTPPPVAGRSVHPSSFPAPSAAVVTLGPGAVTLPLGLAVDRDTTLVLAAGTELELGPGAALLCRGPVVALGTARQPIVIRGHGRSSGVACLASPRAHFVHVQFVDLGVWAAADTEAALSLRGCTDAVVRDCRIVQAGGHGIEVIGGSLALETSDVARAAGHALLARDRAQVHVHGGRLGWARTGVVARDGAEVTAIGIDLTGHLQPTAEERSAPQFAAGRVLLTDAVAAAGHGPTAPMPR
jgi:hypothetical protein